VSDDPFAELSPPYATLVVDPPWRYTGTGRKNATGKPTSVDGYYSTLTPDAIAAMPVGKLAADSAHLYLWVTTPLLFEVDPVSIARSWGFDYKTLLTWVKAGQPGLGSYFRVCTEHVLFCVRGSAPVPPALRERNHFTTQRTRHSVKPDAFYDLVERVSDGPYLDVFSREPRLGWDAWGHGYELPVMT
jgi:N6-adenosine-specific RNA methylase IME4